jgi:hypothetical protein
MSDRFRVPARLAQRLREQKLSLPAVLAGAGLPAGFFEQEPIFVSTGELSALWRAIGEASRDPAIRLKLGTDTRIERYDPAAIAACAASCLAMRCSGWHATSKLTCPEEIRITQRQRRDRRRV